MATKKSETTAVAAYPQVGEVIVIERQVQPILQFHVQNWSDTDAGAPLVINRFSEKARQQIADRQKLGDAAAGAMGKKRQPKDFEELFNLAKHISTEGWYGIHAAAFRNGMIACCRLAGLKMTEGKMSFFIEADGYGTDGAPLVRIYSDTEPEMYEAMVRINNTTCDVRVRPMWKKWSAKVRVRYPGNMYTPQQITKLMDLVGTCNGVGEGRPNSKMGAGTGFGLFYLTGCSVVG